MIKSINNKIIDIKNNNEDINIFIEQYRPFIISATSKILKRYIDYHNDEEYSIALMAFSEAIQSYKVDRGDFLSFAQRLIKLRLIDNYRKQNRQKEAKFSGLEELEDEIKVQYIDKASLENYKQEGIDYLRRLEIEQFSKELVEYDISFDNLIKVSPKWKSTKVLYNALIKESIKNPLVMNSFTRNKTLNIRELEKVTNIPRKKIERARRYIVAVLIILVGDYEYEKARFLRLNKGLVFKVSALMIVGTLGLFGYNAYALPNAYVSLDINPSVELATNSFGTVIDVNPLNEDGEKISEGLTLEGQKVEDALQTLIEEAKNEGYLDENLDNAVAVTVSTDNEAKGEDILKSAEEAVKSELENQNLEDTEIIAENINTERHKEAERLGISPGKMLLIEKLKAADLEVNAEEYANKPVREIMTVLNAKRAEDRAEAKEIKKEAKRDKDSSVEDNSLLGGTEQSSNETVTEEKVETKSINKNDEKAPEKTTEVKGKTNSSSSDSSQKGQQQSGNANSNSQEKSNNAKDKDNNASEKSKGSKPNGK